MYTGTDHAVAATKQATLDAQYTRHAERYVHGRRLVALPPQAVSINPITEEAITEEERAAGLTSEINVPTLPAAAGALSKLSLT